MIGIVEELLRQDNLSKRKIALVAGVSRGTVLAVARGERTSADAPADAELPIASPSMDTTAWCPECGAMATQPCVACRARNAKEKTGREKGAEEAPADFTLHLTPEQQARYEQVAAAHDETCQPRTE
jgi:hypothetical protein